MCSLIIKTVIFGGLIMKNVIKFYEFINTIKTYSVIDNISSFIVLPFIPVLLYQGIRIMLENILGEEFIAPVVNRIFIVLCFILGILWSIKFKTSLKGIFLYENYLQIERHSISHYYLFPINPKIKYKDIKCCTICQKKSESYQQWNEKQLYFVGGASDEYVKIETIYGKIYCFSIENPREFVNEINKRMAN